MTVSAVIFPETLVPILKHKASQYETVILTAVFYFSARSSFKNIPFDLSEILVSLVVRLWTRRPRRGGSISGRNRKILVHLNVLTGSED